MRYNIKGRWQPGHQWESFHWSIIYTVAVGQGLSFINYIDRVSAGQFVALIAVA